MYRRGRPGTPRTIDAHRARLRVLTLPDWGQLRYVDEGRGQAIMLVHGVPTSSWLYRNMIPYLVDRGFRVVAPDLLGFGASDKPRNPDLLTARRQGERLLALSRHLQLEPWTHVCHDAGGPWTWEMMALAPSAVRRLVVLNTIAYGEGWRPPIRLHEGGLVGASVRRTLVREQVGRSSTRIILNAGVEQRGVFADQAVVDGYWRSMPEGTANAVVSFMEHLDEIEAKLPTYQLTLRNFLGRAAIIWGAGDDILLADAQVPELTRALAVDPADVHVLFDAKHFIQEEHPERVAALIAEFVGRWS